jgi:cytochrome d ubiquinol oxidase subunit I
MNTAGWLLTENGRQPWIVQGLMKTANGVSPSVSATDIWISIMVFLLVFIALGVADAWLMLRYGRRPMGQDPLAKVTEETAGAGSTDRGPSEEDEPALVY